MYGNSRSNSKYRIMDDGFITRLRYIWSLIKPTNLFITDDQLERSKVIVDNPSNVSIEELEYHKSGNIIYHDNRLIFTNMI